MGNSKWGPYGAHMDVPRWVPDESLLQNPYQSHMGCPYRTHIITHLGPIWVPYSLLAGKWKNEKRRIKDKWNKKPEDQWSCKRSPDILV